MTGGEALGVYQIFECFLTEVIAPQVPRSRLAYRALRILCDMLRETVFGTITEDQLAEAVAAFYNAVRNTSWGQFLHVKFHWLVHLPAEMKRFGWLPACWELERKHKCPKAFATPRRNLARYSRGLLEDTVCQCFAEISDVNVFQTATGLIDAKPASRAICDIFRALGLSDAEVRAANVRSSRQARFGLRGWLQSGDVILASIHGAQLACEVFVALEATALPMVLVAVWTTVREAGESITSLHRASTDQMELVYLSDVLDVVTHKRLSNHVVKVLVPYHLRR